MQGFNGISLNLWCHERHKKNIIWPQPNHRLESEPIWQPLNIQIITIKYLPR